MAGSVMPRPVQQHVIWSVDRDCKRCNLRSRVLIRRGATGKGYEVEFLNFGYEDTDWVSVCLLTTRTFWGAKRIWRRWATILHEITDECEEQAE